MYKWVKILDWESNKSAEHPCGMANYRSSSNSQNNSAIAEKLYKPDYQSLHCDYIPVYQEKF